MNTLPKSNKRFLGIGNALTDVLAVFDTDEPLERFSLPKGSMQHVTEEKAGEIFEILKQYEFQSVAGGSTANTISGLADLGETVGFVGKVGEDEVGSLFRRDLESRGVAPVLLKGKSASGRAMVFVTGKQCERTFGVYLGAALELCAEDLTDEMYRGYDHLHVEGYLVQNHELIEEALKRAGKNGLRVSVDMASYNVVEENLDFFRGLIDRYVDVVFANETEAQALTGLSDYRKAAEMIAEHCEVAVVKNGPSGSVVVSKGKSWQVPSLPAVVRDATGAGDLYAAGFLYADALGLSYDRCGRIGTILASSVIEVLGTKMDADRWSRIYQDIAAVLEEAGR